MQIVNSAKNIVILIVQIYVQECKFNIIIVVSDIYIHLFLLSLCDTSGSHLKSTPYNNWRTTHSYFIPRRNDRGGRGSRRRNRLYYYYCTYKCIQDSVGWEKLPHLPDVSDRENIETELETIILLWLLLLHPTRRTSTPGKDGKWWGNTARQPTNRPTSSRDTVQQIKEENKWWGGGR